MLSHKLISSLAWCPCDDVCRRGTSAALSPGFDYERHTSKPQDALHEVRYSNCPMRGWNHSLSLHVANGRQHPHIAIINSGQVRSLQATHTITTRPSSPLVHISKESQALLLSAAAGKLAATVIKLTAFQSHALQKSVADVLFVVLSSLTSALQRSFSSSVFTTQDVTLAGTKETILKGGRDLFPLLPKAFEEIQAIGVIGWGSQASAQAQMLADSLQAAGADIKVSVGLREGSASFKEAEEVGFSKEDGTLGEMFDVIENSDLVILLIPDVAQAKLYKAILEQMKPGATLGLTHGFLLGHMDSIGASFPIDIDVIAVCPKGMGPSVRRLHEQGKEGDGTGINSSFAVHQDRSGRATDLALGWGVALESQFMFETSLRSEYCSAIYSERGILMGAVHGIVESLFRRYQRQGMSPEEAFLQSCESITGNIANVISSRGIKAVFDQLNGDDKATFEKAYSASYTPAKETLQEIYDEVSSGNEIRSVIMRGARLEEYPVERIDGTNTWKVGAKVRAGRDVDNIPLNPFTAGVYVATMMAQIDVLLEEGHPYSEVINESVIEAVDFLCPSMHYRGVTYVADNCSFTAKTGSRKWAPRFDYILDQLAYTAVDNGAKVNQDLILDFTEHSVHGAVVECFKLRPKRGR